MAITIKNHKEISKMRAAGAVVAEIHRRIKEAIRPGVTTMELDRIAERTMQEFGATSSFLGYHGFPGHICASINDEIVHGIPGKRALKQGDIIAVDVGAILHGFHGDSAWTYPVGTVSEDAARLLRDTEHSLYLAIAAAKAGNRLGAIGH
ncbi:MAG: type I methionyl aminopeptidase, partial [Chloroflexota bacterium]